MDDNPGQASVGSEMALTSLQRRMSALHTLWRQALASMDAGHVNHFERSGVLPIAFTVFHLVRMEDGSIARLTGADAIWERDGWAPRVGVTIDDPGRERTVSEMQRQRIGDYDEFRAYADAVFSRTDAWLQTLAPAQLTEVIFDRLPDDLSQSYSALVVGSGPLRLHDALECWVYQHGVRHLGELEHARALVGLGGMTS